MSSEASNSENFPRKPFDGSSRPQADLKETFYRYFQDEVANLQEHIDKLERTALVAGERQDATDYCLAGIARLATEVQDALDFIPAYDQRKYTTAINGLKEKFEEARMRFAPKSRFAFKVKKNSSALSLTDVAAAVGLTSSSEDESTKSAGHDDSKSKLDNAHGPSRNYNAEISGATDLVRAPSFRQANSISLSEHEGLHIILPPSAAHATSSGSLTDLKRCIVDMSTPTVNGKPFAGLALKDIANSLIVAGQVAGAAHMTNLQNSIVVVSSRQVRMHDCKNVDVYLSCMSRPIIEDCKDIRFAPLPDCYKKETEESMENHWDQVDDFKWLKAEHSPNWSILPEAERLSEKIWTETVPGKPGKSAEDILKEIGVYKKAQ